MQPTTASTKIYYIDNLRILMTMLVIMHHTLISFGAPGGWYFTDATSSKPALTIMTLLVASRMPNLFKRSAIKEKRMKPAGMAEIEKAKANGQWHV